MADKKAPKIIFISAKCSDMFSMSVMDGNNQHIASYSGYVPSFMPDKGGYGDYVQMRIDIETGVILNWTNPKGDSKFDAIIKGKSGDPKTISISAKCSDMFGMNVMDENNQHIASYDGYVPSFMPDKGGYGDYVQMKIDIETGRILNWTNPAGTPKFQAILDGRAGDGEDSD